MIDITNIMIGDWLESFDGPDWVSREDLQDSSLQNAKQVVLTIEILKKNFPSFDWISWVEKNGAFHCDIYSKTMEVSGTFAYVNELQHALKLCGYKDIANNLIVE